MVLVPLIGRPAALHAQDPRPELITEETEAAIQKGMAFLARTQSRQGEWRAMGDSGAYPCAMTSLAGLALMAGGNTPLEGRYALQVRRAVDWIMSKATRYNDAILITDQSEEQQCMYGHGFGMLFLSQAYGMERDPARRDKIQRLLTSAAVLTGRAQSRDGGWYYTADAGSDEGSVTVTQIQGLRGVRNAGIKVDHTIIQRGCQYIQKSANPDGGIRYQASNPGESRPAITAAAVATMYNAGEYEHPVARGALKFIKARMRDSRGSMEMVFQGHDFYSTLYLAQALYLTGDEDWNDFFPRIRDNLIHTQLPDGSWQGDGVGTTYGTAIALIVLQLPYKNLPIYQR
jgi:hypothetical protein